MRSLFFLALVVLVIVAPACRGNAKVSFEITEPSALVADTVWYEIGVYEGSSCAAVAPMLGEGVPQTASTRVAFRRDAPSAPSIGDLARGTYAFAAVAKGDDCRVLATGCTEVNVDKSNSIAISLAANDPTTGACGTGSVCQAAACVPADDNSDPSVGAGCSLELLGAGPLANPLGGAGTMVSAPAIAPTPSGFVIAYKEIDPDGTEARVTVLPIDTGGGALDPTRPLLKGRCADSDETDGIGLLTNGADGQIILSRAKCDTQPGLELLAFNSAPVVTIDPNFVTSDSQTSQKLSLSNAHVAATTSGQSVLVFLDDGVTRISTIAAGKGIDAPTGTFGGVANMTGAWVAASDKVLALLAAGPLASSTTVVDAGADADAGDGGAEAGPAPTPDPVDAGSTQLGLVMAAPTTTADQFNAATGLPSAPIVFPGTWGAVGALGTRVIVMSDGSGPGRSVSYRTFDLDHPPSTEANGFDVGGTGTVTTGDVVMLADRAFFVALKPGAIELHVFGNATTTPLPLHQIVFGQQPRIPAVAGVRDTGRVAVAATSSRVAVVWTTAKLLTNNDASGGYAVFACTP